MKDGRWEKKKFLGTELRGKTLGIAGLGRIGQEVALRARAFGMRVVAHDPYISQEVAAGLGVELLSLDEMCATADFLTLHLPSTPETRHLFNDDRFAQLQAGHPHHQHGARRADRRSGASARDRAGDRRRRRRSTSSRPSRRPTGRSAKLPQVIATPHIAASTEEAQELVGTETAATVRDFLRDGMVRNAVNFPVDSSRRAPAAAAVDPAVGSASAAWRRRWGPRASRRWASATTARSPRAAASRCWRPARRPASCGRFCRAASRS